MIYVRSNLLYLVSALKVIQAISVVFFKYSLGLLPSSQKFRGIVVVIANFITFASSRLLVLCKGFLPRNTRFFL